MRKLIFALAFGLLVLPNYGFTLGMGEIEVNSALNQQLDAKIEVLSAAPEDAESLIINLASREEFARAGLDRPYELTSLKFTPVVEGGNVYVRVTSPKPVREPFLNFLIEIDWPKGHLLREYTILLDPPVFMGQVNTGATRPAEEFRPSSARTPAPAPAPQAPAMSTRPAEAISQPVSRVQAPPTTPQPAQQLSTYYSAPAMQASEHRIQKGETAWGLANRLRPDSSVSVEQMMLAMLRTNPEVFINGNVNGLKRGYILRVPDSEDIASISQSEALASVRLQNALWREYQQALSSNVPASAISDGADSDTADTASMATSRDGARLAIVSAGEGVSASGEGKDPTEMTAAELREHLALANERLETERLEKEELKGQVSSLQQQVGKMKNLLTIEDQAMTDIQSVGESLQDEIMPAEMTDEDAAMAEETEPSFTSEEEAALQALEELTETETTEDMAEAGEDGLMADGEAMPEEADEELFVEAEADAEVMTSPAIDELDAATDYTPYVAPSLLDTLMSNKLIVGGAALGALILAGLGYLLVKRRRGAEQDVEADLAADLEPDFDAVDAGDDLESVADMISDEEVVDLSAEPDDDEGLEISLDEAEAEVEEGFDSESTVVLPSAMDTMTQMPEPVEEGEESDDGRDDVIAEADVYLAYGIYQQAEELLQNAITEHPEKEAYRVKLAETYFAGKNAGDFEKVAVEMKQYLDGKETPAWLKVVAMGKDLCPDAEVFQQVAAVADLNLDDLMPKSPEPMDFDLGVEEGAEATDLDMDFGGDLDDELDSELSLDETAVISPEEDSSADSDGSDELEFDIGDTEAVEEAAEAEVDLEDEFSLDIAASELDIDVDEKVEEAMDFDLGEELDLSDEAAEVLAEESLDDLTMDELEADAGLSSELDISDAAEEASEEFDLDLSAELDEATTVSADDELDLSDLDDVDEISTKLDLARAYLDMGDSDGARDILDEVMLDGNDEQKSDAEALLKEMG